MTPPSTSRFKLGVLARALLLPLALGLPSAAARAEPAPLLACRGAPALSFTSGEAPTQLVCYQSMLRSGVLTNPNDMDSLAVQSQADGLTAALRSNDVIGVRDWHPHGPPPIASDGLLDFSTAKLVEEGRAGTPGELWWGRVSGGTYRCCTVGRPTARAINTTAPWLTVNENESLLLAIGQETMIRHVRSAPSREVWLQFRTGQRGPWPEGSRGLHFTQHAALGVLSGGSSPAAPGAISGATLDLSVADQLSGTLRFTLQSDGQSAPVSFSVKRDVDENARPDPLGLLSGNPHRLRQGRIAANGRIVDCMLARPYCYFLDQEEVKKHTYLDPQYKAQGMFFGGDGEYLAITFEALLPDPKGGTTLWGAFSGMVILKRSP